MTNIIDFFVKIVFKPKSLLAFITAIGLLFLLLGGLAIPVLPEVATYFQSWGKFLATIGIAGWLLFVLPTIFKLWKSAF